MTALVCQTSSSAVPFIKASLHGPLLSPQKNEVLLSLDKPIQNAQGEEGAIALRDPQVGMKCAQYVFLALLFSTVEYSLAQTCSVESFSVKDNFDPKRYAGKWYALAKKDPEGLFLQDNISAEYTVEEDGTMTASSKGRVKLFGFWVICADMAAQYTVPDPTTPAKMYMTYQGLASYLSSGGDNYWVIDTDYNNYAITYACRSLKEDGSCDDGYSLIFSRNPHGLPPAIQHIVHQKQEEICMSGQFQPVLQSGAC
ncbi:purpurin isoform X1 [Struthio camelus]|uniref:purpurin isoform X1 n=2 Tax=Struthio camelus TaxID=8801 RepID=UPI0036042942